ncbi:hypothetical protein [Sphingobium sp. SYK-6]|uniref:hypothetical protein n=1 Tax=Sphingobium sp. (strain NBRC 103272 / SYK-6) TaxID=627192 RepID=UPI0011D1C664|nr:hypothetical protein [Sphingobium sp. SYK-6]
MKRLIMCSAMALALAGCGGGSGDGDGAEAGDESGAAGRTLSGNASAEEVAEATRGNVSCPPRIATQRPAGAPVDDVVGVRPGMSWDEAANVVQCDNPMLVVTENSSRKYRIETHGAKIRHGFDAKFAEARVEKTGQEIVREMQRDAMRRANNAYEAPLQPGQTRYYVGTMGLPGQERVISVAREEYYPEGQSPTVASVEQALIAKYGTPTSQADNGPRRSLSWKYDPTGRLVTETSPLYHSCTVNPSPDSGSSLSPDCGVTVAADIGRSRDNPGLAHSLAVASQNGASGYAAIENTEQALARADEERQASELQQADQGAARPKL